MPVHDEQPETGTVLRENEVPYKNQYLISNRVRMTWASFEETIVRPHGTYSPCTPLVCLHESGSDLYTLFRNRASYSFKRHVNFAKWPVHICLQLLLIYV